MHPVRVFIGFDAREAVLPYVCMESIRAHSSVPIAFTLLSANNFGWIERHTDGSNAFTYSRFLVPWLCNFSGHAIFLDGDMIVRDDIAKLWEHRSMGHMGLKVVKHDYRTKYPIKYLGAKNEDYPKKNQSSVIVWDCNYFPNRCLTPEFVAEASGSYLHHFEWLAPHQVGELPSEWNHLTMEYDERADAKLLHFTVGSPCFPEYATQEGADEWRAHLKDALCPLQPESTRSPA